MYVNKSKDIPSRYGIASFPGRKPGNEAELIHYRYFPNDYFERWISVVYGL